MFQHIILVKKDKIGKIIFNDPDHFNPLTPDVLKEVIAAMQDMEDDPHIRVIMFAGKGKGFSAGGSYDFLNSLTSMTPVEIKTELYKYFARAVKAIKLSPKPTIAVVGGPAVGAGCEVAVACDFRIVSEKAVFKEVWVKLGLISPLGGMFLLPRLIGLSKATEMFMLGTPVDGQEAERIGLANKCVPAEKLDQEAEALAQELAQSAPLALSAIKDGLRRGMESTLYTEWEANVFAQAALFGSSDFKEALAALKESRQPEFKGK